MPTDPVSNPHLPSASIAGASESNITSWTDSSAASAGTSMSSLAAGLCAGACLGAALALLFAPRRGSEVRSAIRSYASQGGEQLSHLVESGRGLASDARHRATAAIEEGRRAFRTSYESAASASATGSSSQSLTASVAEISGVDRRFEEPLGG